MPLSQVGVRVRLVGVGPLDDVSAEIEQLTRRAEQVQRDQQELMADRASLARELVAAQVPVRDVGALLGVSYQRAQQIATVAVPDAPAAAVVEGRPTQFAPASRPS